MRERRGSSPSGWDLRIWVLLVCSWEYRRPQATSTVAYFLQRTTYANKVTFSNPPLPLGAVFFQTNTVTMNLDEKKRKKHHCSNYPLVEVWFFSPWWAWANPTLLYSWPLTVMTNPHRGTHCHNCDDKPTLWYSLPVMTNPHCACMYLLWLISAMAENHAPDWAAAITALNYASAQTWG